MEDRRDFVRLSALWLSLACLGLVRCDCVLVDADRPRCDSDAECERLVGAGSICDPDRKVCLDPPGLDGGLDGGGLDGGASDGGVDGGADGGSFDGGSDGGGIDGGAGDGGLDGGGPDGGMGECSAAAECESTYGPAPCGSWQCNAGRCEVECPGCTDADRDGYGPEPACAGPDCDDNDDTVFDTHQTACYSGPAGTQGVGVCRAGVATCTGGVWTPCTGEVTPIPEACNALDDDCDGSTDEDLGVLTCGLGACRRSVAACAAGTVGVCTPGGPPSRNDATCDGQDDDCDGLVDEDCVPCVHVAPSGSDGTGDGSAAQPYRSVSVAIADAAGRSAAGAPHNVCVAGGPGCNSTFAYQEDGITVASGVSLLGSYESSTWTRCDRLTTILRSTSGPVVTAPATVQDPTTVDGFILERPATGDTVGVLVDGARRLVLSRLAVPAGVPVASSVGVDVRGGGDVLVTRSRIFAGQGQALAAGVRAQGARVTLERNCSGFDGQGRCDTACGGPQNAGIRGGVQIGQSSTESYAVLLEDAAGSVIESSALCGNVGVRGAGIRILGDADGVVVRGNLIEAWGGLQASHGVWAEGCQGASPWIVDNYQISGYSESTSTGAAGVYAAGDCHPRIDSNRYIRGGAEAAMPGDVSGIFCGADASGISSRCAILGNAQVEGSAFGFPRSSAAVRCVDGACTRVERNFLDGVQGVASYGLILDGSGAFVDANLIRGGCGNSGSTGVLADDAFARLQNNAIFGGEDCNVAPVLNPRFYGLDIKLRAGGNELDVHSNVIDPIGRSTLCESVAVNLEASGGGGKTILRNNVLMAGRCQGAAVAVREGDQSADPRIVEHNLFDTDLYSPSALYLDEGTAALMSAAEIDALTDMTSGGNLEGDPDFVNHPQDLHLRSRSICIDAGTATGAPATDFEGDPRDAMPDIGRDEY